MLSVQICQGTIPIICLILLSLVCGQQVTIDKFPYFSVEDGAATGILPKSVSPSTISWSSGSTTSMKHHTLENHVRSEGDNDIRRVLELISLPLV